MQSEEYLRLARERDGLVDLIASQGLLGRAKREAYESLRDLRAQMVELLWTDLSTAGDDFIPVYDWQSTRCIQVAEYPEGGALRGPRQRRRINIERRTAG